MDAFLDLLLRWIVGFFNELLNLFMYVPRELFGLFVDALVELLKSIPVPDFVSHAGGLLSNISPGVWWFASISEFGFGITAILSALSIRFLLRALPWVF
ncbi:hypothetical protein V5738_08855 [Salinisphaera sp. SPP-AMP-43]|uniref:hypothetical protein n=1 Tax=Salinisphaera sp. SPP-AMP-43 TaxID=3121288 RepID=UPI003C6E2BD2